MTSDLNTLRQRVSTATISLMDALATQAPDITAKADYYNQAVSAYRVALMSEVVPERGIKRLFAV